VLTVLTVQGVNRVLTGVNKVFTVLTAQGASRVLTRCQLGVCCAL